MENEKIGVEHSDEIVAKLDALRIEYNELIELGENENVAHLASLIAAFRMGMEYKD